MKRSVGVLLFLGAGVLVWLIAGCAPEQNQTETPPASVGAPKQAGAGLGTPQPAGVFQVTLSTEPSAPKMGEMRFRAHVSRDGQPVSDAQLNLSLSMTSMKMIGPEVTLEPAGDGEYEATANLSMGGGWEAKVTITAGGETGTAVYHFTVSQ
ncbi:MAG: FixH family protein [Armatimonadetes bacterium]|nr:FixH family protein [Armatimonadota bacterium]